jgi:RNA polymerase sigma-70 factor (ECF subfamily)
MTDAEVRQRLEAALGGDAAAMQSLIDDIAPIVQVRVARALLRRRSQARGRDLRHDLEDLVQEVFAALFAKGGKALRMWDPARSLSFGGFVGFLSEREVSMQMRTGKRNPWTEDPTMDEQLVNLSGEESTVEASIISRDLLARIADRLRERLSPRGRQYFQLLFIDHLDVQEVAHETGTTPAALYAWRNRLSKLLHELRAEIEREEGSHG